MRSHMTRNVCRRLLARPAASPLLSSTPSCPSARRRPAAASRVAVRPPQRRTFLNVFQKPPREIKEPQLEPGYTTMLQFRSRLNDDLRPPPREELLYAFQSFFRHKTAKKKRVNSHQAYCALSLFRYLLENPTQEDGDLQLMDLKRARAALLYPPNGDAEDHLELIRHIHTEIRRRLELGGSPNDPTHHSGDDETGGFAAWIAALTQYGAADEALREAVSFDNLKTRWPEKDATRVWLMVLRGFAKEEQEAKLIEQVNSHFSPATQEVIVRYFCSHQNKEAAKFWFEKPFDDPEAVPTAESYAGILHLLASDAAHGPWLKETFKTLKLHGESDKSHWDVSLRWALLTSGKDITVIHRKIQAAMKYKDPFQPNNLTLHGLLMTAIENNEPLLVERLLGIASKLKIKPNKQTKALLLEHRLDMDDLSGARLTFNSLRDSGITDEDEQRAANRYIAALASVPSPNMDRILDSISAFEHHQISLHPDTVVAVCLAFLKNDQQYEVIDTLSLHTFDISLDERKTIRDAFVGYAADLGNSTRRAWDAYSLLRQFFPETGPEARIKLMNAFFSRNRGDMACYVFGHMRSHNNPLIRPTWEHYVQCFEGLGRAPDLESLKIVHNMLKMDTNIHMNTKMYNALMIAYLACDNPSRALEYWRDVEASPEGPSYNSLAIIFRVCEALPLGEEAARAVWDKMQRIELDIPQNVLAAYACVLAVRGYMDEVKNLLEGMGGTPMYPPQLETLGSLYNAFRAQHDRDEYSKWAATNYPDIWDQVMKSKRTRTDEGLEMLRLNWKLRA